MKPERDQHSRSVITGIFLKTSHYSIKGLASILSMYIKMEAYKVSIQCSDQSDYLATTDVHLCTNFTPRRGHLTAVVVVNVICSLVNFFQKSFQLFDQHSLFKPGRLLDDILQEEETRFQTPLYVF